MFPTALDLIFNPRSIRSQSLVATLPMLTTMTNIVMNATHNHAINLSNAPTMLGYSPIGISSTFMLTIFPFGIDGNINAKHLSSKNTKYTIFSNLLHQSNLASFSSINTTCSHFSPILLHRIFFMYTLSPLTSMSKVKVHYITTQLLQQCKDTPP